MTRRIDGRMPVSGRNRSRSRRGDGRDGSGRGLRRAPPPRPSWPVADVHPPPSDRPGANWLPTAGRCLLAAPCPCPWPCSTLTQVHAVAAARIAPVARPHPLDLAWPSGIMRRGPVILASNRCDEGTRKQPTEKDSLTVRGAAGPLSTVRRPNVSRPGVSPRRVPGNLRLFRSTRKPYDARFSRPSWRCSRRPTAQQTDGGRRMFGHEQARGRQDIVQVHGGRPPPGAAPSRPRCRPTRPQRRRRPRPARHAGAPHRTPRPGERGAYPAANGGQVNPCARVRPPVGARIAPGVPAHRDRRRELGEAGIDGTIAPVAEGSRVGGAGCAPGGEPLRLVRLEQPLDDRGLDHSGGAPPHAEVALDGAALPQGAGHVAARRRARPGPGSTPSTRPSSPRRRR